MSEYYMGIDIGSFETKGVLIDESFRPVCTCAVKHVMDNPKPGYFEHDAEKVWWHDFCAVSRGLIEENHIDPRSIKAVGGSALGCDCLPVDENCRPLRKAILYGIDARCSKEIEELTELYGEDGVIKRFGRPVCSDDVMAKILWVKNNEPEVYEKTYKFLTGSSYIAAKLTGNYVVDRFLAKAAFRPCYNEDGTVNEKECGYFCRPDQLCKTAVITDLAGCVTEKAAAETGLIAGTPVITGSGDSTSEAISVGVVEPGEIMFQFGSSLFYYCCSQRLVRDRRIHSGDFTVPGTFSISGGTNAAGTMTRWVRDSFFGDLLEAEKNGGRNAYEAMTDFLPESSMGLVCLPYLAGERMPINDPKAKGVLFGLTLDHNRGHIYRAALEGVAFSVRQNIRLIESAGVPVDHITAVGGGTKNRAWMQITADIIGKPVRVPKVTIGASYGDALMSAIGAGALGGFGELKKVIKSDLTYVPDPSRAEEYGRLASVYDDLYPALKEIMHRL